VISLFSHGFLLVSLLVLSGVGLAGSSLLFLLRGGEHMDFTTFADAAGDVATAIGTDVAPALVAVTVAGLVLSLTIGWIRRIRSAV